MGEADIVRRGFAKKTGTDKYIPIIKDGGYLSQNSEHYIDGYIKTMKDKYGISEEKSNEDIVAFIRVIEDASEYLFSLNHSQPYSYTGYISGYLRYYYPLEFLTVALNINKDKEEKTNALTAYAKKVNIKIRPPKFRHSRSNYICDKTDNTIYKGIGSIKHLSNDAAERLYELRDHRYNTFFELLEELEAIREVDSRQIDILIKLDYFSEFGDINLLLDMYQKFDMLYGKKIIFKKRIDEYGIPEEIIRKYAEKETDAQYRFNPCGMRKMIAYYYTTINIPRISLTQKIKYQQEHLGYVDYIDPNLSPRYACVISVDTRYSPRAELQCLKNGALSELKVHKRKNVKLGIKTTFSDVPLEPGDIIYMTKCKKEPRLKKENDKWVETDQMEWWLWEYKKVDGQL